MDRSVGRWVGRSVDRSVGRSVGGSVGRSDFYFFVLLIYRKLLKFSRQIYLVPLEDALKYLLCKN